VRSNRTGVTMINCPRIEGFLVYLVSCVSRFIGTPESQW